LSYRAVMESPEHNSLEIVRCDAATEKGVLAVAAQAWAQAERAAQWQGLAAIVRDGRPQDVVLLAARLNDRLVAAQLGQMLPGQVAVVWPPQFTERIDVDRVRLADQLFDRLSWELAAGGAQLAQGLVAGEDPDTCALFATGGYRRAADLLYLAAEQKDFPDEPVALAFEIEPFTLDQAPRLADLIERTYVGTLDCPQIDGLRKTADVIAGYRSVGQFRPELWRFVRHEGADVGCLLVNLHPDVRHAEIVYLALVTEARGRGWGKLLARQAQWLARQANCERVVLAVDAANAPAIRLYDLARFAVFDRRSVWIKSLG
jgi:mycothiol synthase